MKKEKGRQGLKRIEVKDKNIVIRIFKKNIEKNKEEGEENENIELKENMIDPIETFLQDLSKTQGLVNILMKFVDVNMKDSKNEMDEIKKNYKEHEDEESIILRVDKETKMKFDKSRRKLNLLRSGPNKILESFLIYTISLYENFLSSQIKLIFKKFPGKLSNDKKLDYEEFTKYNNIEDIQNYYIEACIRTIISGGSYEQIKNIERLLDRKDYLYTILPIQELIEISSRRNIYVHNEGKINDQYINNCKNVGIINEMGIGDYLKMDKDYFNKVFDIIYETTLKIGYLIACKCYNTEKDIEEIDSFFNGNCFDLIEDTTPKNLDLPLRLLEFAYKYTTEEKNHKDIAQLYFIINEALCYKIKGEKELCNNLLDKRDRSATTHSMQFAKTILKEEWDTGFKMMKSVSLKDGEKSDGIKHFHKKSYQKRPLFFEFRKLDEFKKKYQEIFNEEFTEDQENL